MPGIGGNPGDHAGDTTGQGLIEEDPQGKHLAIGVASFSGTMSSYLRLGTAAPAAGTADAATGEDLAGLVRGFSDDTRDRGSGADAAPAQAFDPVFQGAFTGDRSLDPRRIESAILHTKGGWRDHTDGNRISTTRGDKVEVVQGNYKLVVLGRQDDTNAATDPAARRALLENAAGVDMSGGVTDMDGDPAFARDPDPGHGGPDATREQADLTVEYVWGKQSDGSFGWTMTTTTGHEHPSSPERGNYRVINNNYVDYEEDNYGTDGQRVSQVTSEIYASSYTTSVDVSGTNSTSVWGPLLESYNFVGFSMTLIGAKLMTEVDASIAIFLGQVAAVNLNAFVGAVVTTNVGWTMDLHAGVHTDMHLGLHFDSRNGIHNDVHTLNHVDLHLGTHTEMHTGTHFQFDADAITLTLASHFELHMPAGTMTYTSGMQGQTRIDGATHVNIVGGAAQQIASAHMIT